MRHHILALVIAGVCCAGCAGTPPVATPGGTPRASASEEPALAARSEGDQAADGDLLHQAYTLARARSGLDEATLATADAVSEEAQILQLLGELDQAAMLWSEAILLLENPPSDTTLTPRTER